LFHLLLCWQCRWFQLVEWNLSQPMKVPVAIIWNLGLWYSCRRQQDGDLGS
jgi:hypothetical protein